MVCDNGDEMRSKIASYVYDLCKGKERMVVAVSGGSMPGFLSGLSEAGVDLSKWDIFFCDERLVPLDSDDSNFKACQFFTRFARVHAVQTDLEPMEALKDYEKRFIEVGGHLDLALLGCGPDGHTASLFPQHPIFADTNPAPFRIVLDSPKPPPKRITFSRFALANTDHTIYIAAGASKAPLFATLFFRDSSSSILLSSSLPDLPVAKIAGRISSVWFIDTAAARHIPPFLAEEESLY